MQGYDRGALVLHRARATESPSLGTCRWFRSSKKKSPSSRQARALSRSEKSLWQAKSRGVKLGQRALIQRILQRQPRHGISKSRYDDQSHFPLKGSASFPCLKTAASRRATRSITSTITSSARSSITLTLFTRSLSVDGRAAASMQTDLIQLLLPIPLAEATSQINDGGDESTALTANNQPAIKNLFTTHLD